MAVLASDIVKGVYQILGRPSQTELPYQHVLGVLNRRVRGRMLDLQLSDKKYLATLRSIYPTSRDFRVSLSDFSVPERVESRTLGSTSEDDWTEWEVVEWGGASPRGRAVSFYGMNPTRILFSDEVTNLEFRMLYETNGVKIAEMTDALGLADIFEPLLVDEVALECVAMCDGKSAEWVQRKNAYLATDYAQQERRFRDWVRRSYGSGVYQKDGFGEGLPSGLGYDGVRLISD